MKAIMVMFDSLNRHMLPPYGCEWIHAPNFSRLYQHSVRFDNAYVGSMPCIPARRELHTGRYNFLHRSWGPLEPFDDSMPQILSEHGIHTHLVTDHQHYWEDGGATYHNRYTTYELVRGQEGDRWKGLVGEMTVPSSLNQKEPHILRQDWINRSFIKSESDMPQSTTFALGMEFIQNNYQADDWFLQIETFDPHEPFFTQQQFKALYPHDYAGPHYDWPPYGPVSESPDQIEHMRYEYAALVSMCDHSLGQVLDLMDKYDLWDDTLLIVNTDHGFLLGEHDWWAKALMPWYNELAQIPLFVWDPRCRIQHEQRASLVQTIDLAPTLLEFFDIECPADMQGAPLRATIADDTPLRDYALFGMHGGQVNITDGCYVYMRGPQCESNEPLYEYTLMPTHMRRLFAPEELQNAELVAPFSFTKGCPTLKLAARPLLDVGDWSNSTASQTLLFDIAQDPTQQRPIESEDIEAKMLQHMITLMQKNEAPPEQYVRLGLA